MRLAKIVAIAVLVYAGLVVAFESWLGSSQPAGQGTLVITTIGEDGTAHDRVVANYETDGQLYVSANHWPRAWYRRALSNPDVRAAIDAHLGTTGRCRSPVRSTNGWTPRTLTVSHSVSSPAFHPGG